MEWDRRIPVLAGAGNVDVSPQINPGAIDLDHVFMLNDRNPIEDREINRFIASIDLKIGASADTLSFALYAEDDATKNLDWADKKWDLVVATTNLTTGIATQTNPATTTHAFTGGGRYFFRVLTNGITIDTEIKLKKGVK